MRTSGNLANQMLKGSITVKGKKKKGLGVLVDYSFKRCQDDDKTFEKIMLFYDKLINVQCLVCGGVIGLHLNMGFNSSTSL